MESSTEPRGHDHELSFGGRRFVIRVSGDPEVARIFAVVRDGTAMCVAVEANGSPIAIEEQSDRDALGLAARYLRERCGDQDFASPRSSNDRVEREVLDEPWVFE